MDSLPEYELYAIKYAERDARRAPADLVAGLQDEHVHARGAEVTSAGEAGQAGTDHDDVRLG